METLPDSIGQLANLQSLEAHRNKLTALPESTAGLGVLRVLGLSANQLSEVPSSISRLTNLRRLELSNNQIPVLPESIGQLAERYGWPDPPLERLPIPQPGKRAAEWNTFELEWMALVDSY